MSAQVHALPRRGDASTNAEAEAGSQSAVIPFPGRAGRLAAIHQARKTHASHLVRDGKYTGYSHPLANVAAVNILLRMLVEIPVESIGRAALELPNDQFDAFANGLGDLVDFIDAELGVS